MERKSDQPDLDNINSTEEIESTNLNLDLNFYSPENFWPEVCQRLLGGFLMMVLYYLWFHLIPNFVPASVYAKFILVAVALLITCVIKSSCIASDDDTASIHKVITPIHDDNSDTTPIQEGNSSTIPMYYEMPKSIMLRDINIADVDPNTIFKSCDKPFSQSLSHISETNRENPNVKEQSQSSEDDDDDDVDYRYLTTPIEASDEDYHKRNVVCCDLILVSNGMVTGKSIDTG